ncbi:hypothetical protein [Spirillospora sp. NPDC047279]
MSLAYVDRLGHSAATGYTATRRPDFMALHARQLRYDHLGDEHAP